MLIQVTLCVDTSRTLVRGTTSSMTHSYFFGSYYLDELIDEEEPNLVQPGVDSKSPAA